MQHCEQLYPNKRGVRISVGVGKEAGVALRHAFWDGEGWDG